MRSPNVPTTTDMSAVPATIAVRTRPTCAPDQPRCSSDAPNSTEPKPYASARRPCAMRMRRTSAFTVATTWPVPVLVQSRAPRHPAAPERRSSSSLVQSQDAPQGAVTMKWVTRERVKVDRVACPWLIKKFVDPEAEFLFVPPEQVLGVAERDGATPFAVPGVELGHHDGKCSFEAIVERYRIEDPAIALLAKIVHGADVAQDLYGRPEAPGLKAIAEGFGYLGLRDDHEILAREFAVYDALYAFCHHKVT